MEKIAHSLKIAGHSTLVHFFRSNGSDQVEIKNFNDFLECSYGLLPDECESIILDLQNSGLIVLHNSDISVTEKGQELINDEKYLINICSLAYIFYIYAFHNERKVSYSEISDFLKHGHHLSQEQVDSVFYFIESKNWVEYAYVPNPHDSISVSYHGELALDTPFLTPKLMICAKASVYHLSGFGDNKKPVSFNYFKNFLMDSFYLDNQEAKNIIDYLDAYDYIDNDDEFVDSSNVVNFD